jgi:hypothetical protein
MIKKKLIRKRLKIEEIRRRMIEKYLILLIE